MTRLTTLTAVAMALAPAAHAAPINLFLEDWEVGSTSTDYISDVPTAEFRLKVNGSPAWLTYDRFNFDQASDRDAASFARPYAPESISLGASLLGLPAITLTWAEPVTIDGIGVRYGENCFGWWDEDCRGWAYPEGEVLVDAGEGLLPKTVGWPLTPLASLPTTTLVIGQMEGASLERPAPEVAPIPLPASLPLLAAALGGLAAWRTRAARRAFGALGLRANQRGQRGRT